ncbi:hypothetical protein ALC57_13148 [Trachymyrmex cornetzi]|uniref:DUF4817 domain-containing protein n=1 Tax=Trachymyrmex cornetzi TaxID=471704 RepID=A0A151J006_9HYME|nr:hypothetical protein ALC57_13148 [Trachymyrmex cornetzi]
MYSYNEKVDMLLIFDACKRNARETAILYVTRYPQRLHPQQCFRNIEKKYCATTLRVLSEMNDWWKFWSKVSLTYKFDTANCCCTRDLRDQAMLILTI